MQECHNVQMCKKLEKIAKMCKNLPIVHNTWRGRMYGGGSVIQQSLLSASPPHYYIAYLFYFLSHLFHFYFFILRFSSFPYCSYFFLIFLPFTLSFSSSLYRLSFSTFLLMKTLLFQSLCNLLLIFGHLFP